MQPRTAFQTWIFCVSTFLLAAIAYAADPEPQKAPIPIDQLSAACVKAKAEFHPITQIDVAQAKAVLLEALDRLDQRLTLAGSGGEDWRKYLHWNAFQETLGADKQPDLALLSRTHARYVAGYEGLELVWFVDVQRALHNYIATIGAVDSPQVRTAYENKLDSLAASLDAYVAKPTTESALAISESVRWLQQAHQAPELVQAILQQFARPNVIGEVSGDIVGAGIAEPVDDVTQVSDCILGTSVSGTAHTVGKTSASLSPNPEMGVIDTLFFGAATSNNVGYHHPVTIFSSATTDMAACKRIWINDGGLSSHPAVANAETSICIHDIRSDKGRRLIEKMAWKRAGKQQAKAECIASRHAEQRLNERIDNQAVEQLDKANKQYVEKYQRPFTERKLFPELLRFSTTAQALCVLGLQAGGGKLAAPGSPPPVVEGADMTLRLHESAINNLAFDALAGRTVYEEKVQAAVTDALGHLPEKLKGDEDGKPWAITFAARQPVSVTFADDGFTVIIHGVKYYKGDEYCDATNVSAVYKIEKSPKGFKAVRQGSVTVIASDKVPDTGGKQTTARALLKRRFEKVFEPEFLGEGLELSGKWKAVGKLLPIQVECRDGWLVIAWKRAAAGPTVAVAK
jgi:hypothetical protein